jgi:Xaa-Pro aminopeptidase
MGSGPIRPNTPLVVDIFPRDNASAVYTDMTRTFVVGDVPEDVREWHRLCKEALDAAVVDIRAVVEARPSSTTRATSSRCGGEPTQRTKKPGEVARGRLFPRARARGRPRVHEAPSMGLLANKTLVAGDVVTVEPGLYRAGYGGVRLEDIVLVTGGGAEVITDYPYDLEP